MATSAQNPNDPSNRMRRITDPNIRSRLPQDYGYNPSSQPPPPINPPLATEPAPQPAPNRRRWWNSEFFPVFWTIASLFSIGLNMILCLALVAGWQMWRSVQPYVAGQPVGILGGLYTNFEAMDRAIISRNIAVDANIPLSLMVPVQTQTTILLSESTQIRSPRVFIKTGGLTLDAPALVTLPKGQPLVVDLNFMLPVNTSVPVHLDVPVDIPLNQTQLHGPFVGLQQVVRPWYCLFLPKSQPNYQQICGLNAVPPASGIIVP